MLPLFLLVKTHLGTTIHHGETTRPGHVTRRDEIVPVFNRTEVAQFCLIDTLCNLLYYSTSGPFSN